MKRILVVAALLIQLVAAGAALAQWVPVDFSGIATTDITIQNNLPGWPGFTLNGVTFSYDNLTNTSTADFASVDTTGIFGTTFGALIFDFSAPVTGLQFNFALFGTSTSDNSGALDAILKLGGNDVTDFLVPAAFVPYDPLNPSGGGDAFGSFSYGGAAFNQISMFFSLDAPVFTVDTISYEPAPASVPEPATLLLLAAGLLGLGGSRRFMRKQGYNHFGFSEIA